MTHYPETSVFLRKLRWEYPRITHGKGSWIYDDAGNSYLDACGGAFVSNLGHGIAEIGAAMAAQASKLAYVSGMTLTHTAVEEFAEELARLAPGDLDKVYPLSSGSDAVEAALKLARQYWAELGRPGKHRIIALNPSYHGNTLLALSASAREHYKTMYKGWLVDVARVPAYDAGALETAMTNIGPDSIAAFILEPVGGSSSGALVPEPGYLRQVREICDRNDVLFIADEILCGAGRTGTWSALEPDQVVPDIQVLGKGIAAGFAPLAAVVAPTRIVDAFARGSGGLNHAQTFSHHAVSCAAGTATLRYLARHKLVERCARMGVALHAKLADLRGTPHVGAIRGRGLLAGIELVDDPSTGAPFPRSLHVAESLTRAALDAGLIVWPNVGHVNGTEGDLVMLAPPFTVSEDEIDQIVGRLGDAIRQTVRQLAVRA
ncbi:MAG TPA: aminotransferase class III-fold pyridoxal phosphate-dependent enzyme [Gemmatimonadaceae bacterium]|nr:aminotransferase class III-fold pyridoxal phosphate-dependent enzyme [Gemmatimonadaceae bacterium]